MISGGNHWSVYVLLCEWNAEPSPGWFHWYVCIVAVGRQVLGSPYRKLVELLLDGGSGALCGSSVFDVPGPVPNGGVTQIRSGPLSPFLLLPTVQLVFHTRTRRFYAFPKFRIALVRP